MHRTHNFLFIMDPVETLNLATETSLLFMEELLTRGHKVLWAEVGDLILRQDKLFASVKAVSSIAPITFNEATEISVNDVDVLLVRPDPPFDTGYLHLTYLLDFVAPGVLQLNPATALRNFNEKLSTLRFSDLAPQTVTTGNHAALVAFLEEHGEIVIKPLDECSGRGIERVSKHDCNTADQIQTLLQSADGKPRIVTAQEFLTDVARGDKRVYLVGGEPVGLVNRIPKEGGWLGNIHQGAKCVATHLTRTEQAVITRIKPFLEEHGILLVGLDLIGGKITEINITSPSAVRQINEVTGEEVHKKIIDLVLDRLARKPSQSPNLSSPGQRKLEPGISIHQ